MQTSILIWINISDNVNFILKCNCLKVFLNVFETISVLMSIVVLVYTRIYNICILKWILKWCTGGSRVYFYSDPHDCLWQGFKALHKAVKLVWMLCIFAYQPFALHYFHIVFLLSGWWRLTCPRMLEQSKFESLMPWCFEAAHTV